VDVAVTQADHGPNSSPYMGQTAANHSAIPTSALIHGAKQPAKSQHVAVGVALLHPGPTLLCRCPY
jgi:hypothetical protein